MKRSLAFLAALTLPALACTTAKTRVLPGADVNEVVATDYEREDAANAAVEAAEEYCEKSGKTAVFVKDEGTAYQGKIDESANSGLKAVGGIAAIAGAADGYALGHGLSSNEDYKTKMQFKCISH